MTDENPTDNLVEPVAPIVEEVIAPVEDGEPIVEDGKPVDSEMEDGTPNDEVESLRAEINALNGKLKTIRTTADKNAAAAATANVTRIENMRLKAAFKAGLDEESLILVTAEKEEDIAKQVELISRKLSNSSQQFQTLQGKGDSRPAGMSKLEQKISDQLSNIKL